MRSEHMDIGNNIWKIVRADRGEFDLVYDDKHGGWYIETIIDAITMRSKTYPHKQAAETALKEKAALFEMPDYFEDKPN